MFMWMVFVRLSLLPSSRNQKKRKYFFQKAGVFGLLFVSLPCRLIRFQQQTIQNLNKLLNYEHIEKAIWWAKNY